MSFDLWTLGFQAVNVLVLIWLLHRFFWKPVAALIADRQAKAATLLEDATEKRTAAEVALHEIKATQEALAAERDAIHAAARKDAEAAHEFLLAQARAEVDRLHDTARAARVRAGKALKTAEIENAKALAVTIARQLAARLDGAAVEAAFLGWLVEGITALSDEDRKALAGAELLDLISATPTDAASQQRITQAIAQVTGTEPRLTFRTDPALIAGYELHSPHFSLHNSWAADLARIATAIAAGGGDAAQSDGVQSDGARHDAA